VLQSKKIKEVNALINSKKMKGRMVEMGITQKDIAKELGVAAPTVSQKINNVRPMDLAEAEKIADLLNISDNEFREYFFCNGVA
jgi:transcriptional regulator with XRE-family HTH domain